MAQKADDNPVSTSSSSAHPLQDLPSVIPPKSSNSPPASMITDDPLLRQSDAPHQPTTTPAHPPPDTPAAKEGFNYWTHLPYDVEDEATRIAHLNEIIADLYTYIRAGDLEGGARTSSRQIKRWLHLKFKMPKETRKTLIKLYYELSLTFGIDASAADTFANMFKLLASYPPSPQKTGFCVC
jgi:Proteasome-substrate-size regulator, N-terminal